MEPVRTRRSNFVYRGPTPDVGDAWVQRQKPGEVYMTWRPTDEERKAIADGALIRMGIFGREPISPVSLGVDPDPELGLAGEALSNRARNILRKLYPTAPIGAGFWSMSADVWEQLQTEGVLDNEPGALPTLIGRPLMTSEELPAGTLEYVAS